ncbi:hypothetical protein VCHA40O237_10003 [Vibrio chagasii]|nr:hypothetical protein VCHA40O237_10003 [Vibrio chagasii]CAH7114934.1 hypothetical protein VCHA44O286_10409 [Vibrio chagasii]CAH7185663.1 hypothetical protein VCHA48P437_20004 [Vibrio chagasii]CAH7310608.1 hypothetical protein VCHA55O508_10409 [Vibrio chagasii]
MIRNTWHFCYALRLAVKVVCGRFGIALIIGQQGANNAICGLCHRLHNLNKYMFIIMLK